MRFGGARLIGHYHSHPRGDAEPSPRDAEAATTDGALWLIAAGADVTGWCAGPNGSIHGRFVPVALDVRASPCADGGAPPEGAQLKDVGGEFSR
jgi:proteasome lid subunit RPN8/RPN11